MIVDFFFKSLPAMVGDTSWTTVKRRLALLLRRRVGSLREDKDFDRVYRRTCLHVLCFSMIGLITMLTTSIVTWFANNAHRTDADAQFGPPTDTYYNDPDVSPTLLNVMHLSQAVVTSSTIVTIVLITQKYRLLLMEKRAEWSGANIFEIEMFRGSNVADAQMQDYFTRSYSFFMSSMFLTFLAEVIVHVPHPIMWLAEKPDPKQDLLNVPNLGLKMLQLLMFLRLYLVPSILHVHSAAFMNRFEVVSSDRELLAVCYRIRTSMTLKMNFYKYTSLTLVSIALLSLLVFGYSMFTIERVEVNGDPAPDVRVKLYNAFGRSDNAFWFGYVTFATVGYGEFVPVTLPGRLAAALTAVFGITTFIVFSAVLVSRISLTKEQKFAVEFLHTRTQDQLYRAAATKLIGIAVLTKFYPIMVARRNTGDASIEVIEIRHKANRLYHAVKNFRVARRNLEASFMQAEDSVISQKMEAVELLVSAVRRELEEHQANFDEVEEMILSRLAATLNRAAGFHRAGHVAV